MLSLSPAVIYSCGPGPDYPTTFISRNVVERLGYPPSDFYTDPFFWTKLLHPDDSADVLRKLSRIEEVDQISYEYRVRHRDGHYLWLHDQLCAMRDAAGKLSMMVGCWVDASERKRTELLQEGQNRVLACLVAGSSLEEALTELVHSIEAHAPGMLCSVLIYDPGSKCLRHGAAPSLPREYNEAIDGLRIGATVGSCGKAAYRRERVITEDIEADPLWTEFRELARRHGLRACWSQPILCPDGRVLGTFAMHYRMPRGPNASELELIEHAANLAAVAVQRKQADEALKASEARYQDLYDNAPDMFASVDAKTGRIVRCNSTLALATGFTKDEIVGRYIFDLYCPGSADEVKRAFDRFVRSGDVRDAELQLRRKDGTKIDVSLNVSAVRDDAGQVLYSRSIWRDITERKRTEAVLLEQKRLTELTADVRANISSKKTEREALQHCVEAMVRHLDAALARIWTLNSAENLLELQASAGLYRHTDGPHSRIRLGELKIGLIAQERKPHLTNAVIGDPRINDQQWAKTEGIVAFAGYPLAIEDRVVGVMAMFSRVPLSGATLEGMSAVADVIASGIERKRTEDALRRSERLASIGTLAAGIAHEVNNPITAILLAAQRAQTKKGQSDEPQHIQDCLAGIVSDAERCERIIANVLQFARNGTTEIWPAEINDIVRRAIDLTQPYASQKGARLEVNLAARLPQTAVNPNQMEQVFVNLLKNAVESGTSGNRVTIRTDSTAGTVRIVVTDSGRGMTIEQRSHLFDPFYTTREREGGTGLGLSIAHGIVLSHGGTIDVESELGRGTTITVGLPRVSASRRGRSTHPKRKDRR